MLWLTLLLCNLATIRTVEFDKHILYPQPTFKLDMYQNIGVAQEFNNRRRLSKSIDEHDSSPLFEGLGTHYSFIWVGTPPQRVSVIVDTGSHHTAFPCVGCKCGKHMDPYFDPLKSSTSAVKDCGGNKSNGGNKCFFRQSYSEGSSWNAYKVKDKVWMGGPNIEDKIHSRNRSVNFEFGCQESETGLFRTQNVDGIMGMSAAEDTLPFQLFTHKLTSSRVFAMCFKTGGGVLTLGGVDTSLNQRSVTSGVGSQGSGHGSGERVETKMQFAKLLKAKGWFTVKLLDVLMRNPSDGSIKSIGGSAFKYNSGKGTIVDSGTTDTYLPSAVANNFKTLFQAITGMQHYSNNVVELSNAQFARLPVIVYRMEGLEEGSVIDVEVAPTSYMEAFKGSRYASRVYLTEGTGAVLGANFMNAHNVVFDIDQLRVGFAPSDCIYKPDEIVTKSVSTKEQQNSKSVLGWALSKNSTSLQKGSSNASSSMKLLREAMKFEKVDSLLPH